MVSRLLKKIGKGFRSIGKGIRRGGKYVAGRGLKNLFKNVKKQGKGFLDKNLKNLKEGRVDKVFDPVGQLNDIKNRAKDVAIDTAKDTVKDTAEEGIKQIEKRTRGRKKVNKPAPSRPPPKNKYVTKKQEVADETGFVPQNKSSPVKMGKPQKTTIQPSNEDMIRYIKKKYASDPKKVDQLISRLNKRSK